MTVAPHQSSEIEVATLVKIRVPGFQELRVQNYCLEPYFYQEEIYAFCGFTLGGVSRQLDLSNSSTTIALENRHQSLDGIGSLRQMLRNQDGWRRAKITAVTLFPEYPDAQPIINRLQVLGSSISGAMIELRLKSPIEAVNAQIPTSLLLKTIAPELPQFASSNRF